jgi:glutaconate CoA-transferase, subunit A
MPLAAAVREHVRDGDTVYLGNFGAQLFCVGAELIRQGRRELTLVAPSGGLLMDQLLGASVASGAIFSHCWSPVGPAPTWNFRRFYESGTGAARCREMSMGALYAALLAGAWGVPFMPFSTNEAYPYLAEATPHGGVRVVRTDYGTALAAQAIRPDVAFVYADCADSWGNAVILGPSSETVAAAEASERVVLVVEEVVDEAAVRDRVAALPGLVVSALVECPGAVAPDGAVGRYPRDVGAYADYARQTATHEGFERWLAAVAGQ